MARQLLEPGSNRGYGGPHGLQGEGGRLTRLLAPLQSGNSGLDLEGHVLHFRFCHLLRPGNPPQEALFHFSLCELEEEATVALDLQDLLQHSVQERPLLPVDLVFLGHITVPLLYEEQVLEGDATKREFGR